MEGFFSFLCALLFCLLVLPQFQGVAASLLGWNFYKPGAVTTLPHASGWNMCSRVVPTPGERKELCRVQAQKVARGQGTPDAPFISAF